MNSDSEQTRRKRFSRREFLLLVGATSSTALLAACGSPAQPEAAEPAAEQEQPAAQEEQPAAEADAAWTDVPGDVLVVLTADCLPVVLTDSHGTEVAVAHAGWRGLAGAEKEGHVGLSQTGGPAAHFFIT